MTDTEIGIAGIVALFALFVLRMPVGLSMLTVGVLGNIAIRGWNHALPSLSSETFAIARPMAPIGFARPNAPKLWPPGPLNVTRYR